MIVDRRELRERIHRLLAMLTHFAPPASAAAGTPATIGTV